LYFGSSNIDLINLIHLIPQPTQVSFRNFLSELTHDIMLLCPYNLYSVPYEHTTMPYAPMHLLPHYYMSDSFYELPDILSFPMICPLHLFDFSKDSTTLMSRVTPMSCHLRGFITSDILTTHPPQCLVTSDSGISSTSMMCHLWISGNLSTMTSCQLQLSDHSSLLMSCHSCQFNMLLHPDNVSPPTSEFLQCLNKSGPRVIPLPSLLQGLGTSEVLSIITVYLPSSLIPSEIEMTKD